MLFYFLTTLLINAILMVIYLMLSKKNFFFRESISSFECGFDPNSLFRKPFSVRFFFIMLMFLIFDIEIVLLLPIPYSWTLVPLKTWILISFFFITILIGGLWMEWKLGSIQWY